jgi:hypothetical protein
MSIASLRGAVNWALMVALVLGAGAMAQAQNENEGDGKVVRIGSPDDQKSTSPRNENVTGRTFGTQAEMPKYWIGLLGGAIPADSPLRAHLDLPEGEGLIVANVVPDGPAAKAGLKQHDILLRANDIELHDMQALVDLVASEGSKSGRIKLDFLRRNEHQIVSLVPAERPADAAMPQSGLDDGGFGGFNFQGGDAGQLRDLMKQFGGDFPPQFRNFGHGVIVGGGMPNGVSISIQKQEGQPTQITVKRGEETWTVSGDDPESLKQLPEDLRPAVERMLHGDGIQFDLPNFEQRLGPAFNDGGLRERLERMEKRLEEMQKHFRGDGQAESNDEANK